MKKIYLGLIAAFIALIMVMSIANAENLIDFGNDKNGNPYAVYEYTWWDNLFKEQSVYDVAFGTGGTSTFTRDNSVSYTTHFFTKFTDVKDYKIIFSFFDLTSNSSIGVYQVDGGFEVYGGGKPLEQNKNYAFTQTISSTTLKNSIPDSTCNHYVSLMGMLFVKIPANKIDQIYSDPELKYNKIKDGDYYWVQEYHNTAGTHANSKYTLLTCPTLPPTCNPPAGNDGGLFCVGSEIRQKVIWGDCSSHQQLVQACGNGCSNAKCITGCDKTGQLIKEYGCDGTEMVRAYYGTNCEYVIKKEQDSSCGGSVVVPPVVPPVEPPVIPPIIKQWVIENGVCIQKEDPQGFVSESDCKTVLDSQAVIIPPVVDNKPAATNDVVPMIDREIIFYIVIGIAVVIIGIVLYNKRNVKGRRRR